MTGALSPVIADSSTEATPSTISPSPGMNSPAETITRSSFLSCGAGTSSVWEPESTRCAIVSVFALRRLSACALPRPSAIASAKFANNTVNQSQRVICNSNPAFVTPGIGAMIPRINCKVVRTLPTSTTNMTGLPIILRGFNLTNESTIARLTIFTFQIACVFVFSIMCFRRLGLWSLAFGLGSLVLEFCVPASKSLRVARETKTKVQRPKTSISKRFSCLHQQMLNNWSQAQCRKESQRAHDNDHAYQQRRE